jgi:hypothetical protein
MKKRAAVDAVLSTPKKQRKKIYWLYTLQFYFLRNSSSIESLLRFNSYVSRAALHAF